MSNPVPLPYPPRPPTNRLAVVGFIFSILGFVTGFVLCPIGFILCFFALFKRPRGLAFAGMVIGFIGTVIMAVILFLFGAVIVACITLGTDGGRTAFCIQIGQYDVQKYLHDHGTLPDDLTGQSLISSQPDAWEHRLLYRRLGTSSYEIRSAGPDGMFNTGDDISRTFP